MGELIFMLSLLALFLGIGIFGCVLIIRGAFQKPKGRLEIELTELRNVAEIS